MIAMQSNTTENIEQQYIKNEYRSIFLCIDSYENRTLAGRLYNPYFGNARYFENVIQFLIIAEDLFDRMAFPQPFTATRKFWNNTVTNEKTSSGKISEEYFPKRGKLASFFLKVVFRQNGSWQGSISCLDHNKEESFRSVLELVKILDNALNASELSQESCMKA